MNRIKIKNLAVWVMFLGLSLVFLRIGIITIWGITLVDGVSYSLGAIIWMMYHSIHDKAFRSRDKSALQTILILTFPILFSFLFIQVIGANFALDNELNRGFDMLTIVAITISTFLTFITIVIYFKNDTMKVQQTLLVIVIYGWSVVLRFNDSSYTFFPRFLVEVNSAVAAILLLLYFYQFDKQISVDRSTPR